MLTPIDWSHHLPLNSATIRVRAFVASDITDAYIAWLNDPEVVRFSNQRFIAHSVDSVTRYFDSFANSPHYFLAIEDVVMQRVIGTMTVYAQPHHQTADVGIMLGDKTYWGKGYGRQAWCMVIDWLLSTCHVRKVTAGTLACNLGMIKLMECAGMTQEATRMQQELVQGQAQDIVYYAKFNAQ